MFKVGDKVRPRREGVANYGNPVLVDPESRFVGIEGTVTHIHNLDPAEGGYYGVSFESGYDSISGVYLELVESATPAATTPAATPPTPDTPTLRDQFAMAALGTMRLDDRPSRIAATAYIFADAMLAARSKTGGDA